MKKYIRSNMDLARSNYDIKLPHLDKAIEDSKHTEFELFDDCDWHYWVEDDGVENAPIIWLADYNEYIGSSEFYEYSFVDKLIKSFEQAVAKDTGYRDFMFEPYDSVEFCERDII